MQNDLSERLLKAQSDLEAALPGMTEALDRIAVACRVVVFAYVDAVQKAFAPLIKGQTARRTLRQWGLVPPVEKPRSRRKHGGRLRKLA